MAVLQRRTVGSVVSIDGIELEGGSNILDENTNSVQSAFKALDEALIPATENNDGLMTKEDKSKLDGITDYVVSVADKTGVVTLDKSDVGLSNVDNTADASKNVLSASKLTTPRNITLNGDVSSTASFDGSSNITLTSTLADSGINAGTYTKVTFDSKGRATYGISPNTLAGYGIQDASHIGHTHGVSDISGLTNVALTGDYNDLINKPTIPLATSQLSNDSGFLTIDNISQELSDYATIAITDALDTRISNLELSSTSGGIKGAFETVSGLDTLDENTLSEGAMYGIRSTNDIYVYVASGSNFDYQPSGWTGGFVQFANIADITGLVDEEAQARIAGDALLESSKLGITENAVSATKLITPRNISGVPFDGTSDISIPFGGLTNKPTTLSGYGITDGITEAQVMSLTNDYYSKTEIDSLASIYATKSTTLSGYGITDAYTKTEVDNSVDGKIGVLTLDAPTTLDTFKKVADQITIDQGIVSNLASTVSNKVDKVSGKQLSTEDYTTTEKNKLAGIESGAQVNTVTSVAGRTGAVTLTKTDVGLSALTNVQQLAYTQTLTLTGDVTASNTALNTGTIATTLANSGVVAGTYNNSATQVRPFTVDSKGRITSIGTAVTINPTAKNVSFSPSGNISSSDVSDALVELDSEKQATLVSGTNIKTIQSNSLLGSGNIQLVQGNSGTLQFNNNGQFGGVNNVVSDNGDLLFSTITGTTSIPTDGTKVFGKTLAKRSLLAIIGPSGQDTSLQPILARNKVAWWNPPGNATTVPGVVGLTAPTAMGTVTARNVATTNVLTRMKRLGYQTNTTVGTVAGHYVPNVQFSMGDGNKLGGFTLIVRFGISDSTLVPTARTFVGMTSSTSASTNVEPSTLTNSIGVAQLSTDNTQWYIVYGGSSAQTAIPLGTALGSPNNNANAWEFALFVAPNSSSTIHYQMTNLSTEVAVDGSITANNPGVQLPSSTTLLNYRAFRTRSVTTAVAIDICSVYIETDQ